MTNTLYATNKHVTFGVVKYLTGGRKLWQIIVKCGKV